MVDIQFFSFSMLSFNEDYFLVLLKIICLIQFIIEIMFNSNMFRHGQEMEILCLVKIGKTFSTWHHAFSCLIQYRGSVCGCFGLSIQNVFSVFIRKVDFPTFYVVEFKTKIADQTRLWIRNETNSLYFRVYHIFICHTCTDNKNMAPIKHMGWHVCNQM